MVNKIIEFIIGMFFISLGFIPFVILVVPRLNVISPVLAIIVSILVCLFGGWLLYINVFGVKDNTVKKDEK
jgi:ABC-type transporter Mla maintaining outer membrane lipid asymmetry permease subunit MlaE